MTTHGLQDDEIGAARDISESSILAALRVPRLGRLYDLEVVRARGMPLWEGHPTFEVMTYRTPSGIQAQGDQEWLRPENNKPNIGVISDLIMGTTHTGTHIDALAHITVGEDNHWYNGFNERQHLGDWGPLRADASVMPPLILRGVLIDVARSKGTTRLPKGYGISQSDLEQAVTEQRVELRPGDAALIRTGQMSVWPDKELLNETIGSGLNQGAARWLVEDNGILLVGDDTESFEQVPAEDPSSPDPVHSYLLVDRGVFIMENLFLEQLARDRVHEFLLIVLPLKVKGATGSMCRPVAVT